MPSLGCQPGGPGGRPAVSVAFASAEKSGRYFAGDPTAPLLGWECRILNPVFEAFARGQHRGRADVDSAGDQGGPEAAFCGDE